jgi:DNA-directed RNA polymerase specialized sigma24 family protein
LLFSARAHGSAVASAARKATCAATDTTTTLATRTLFRLRPLVFLTHRMATPPSPERRRDEPLSGQVDFSAVWPEVRRGLLASLVRRVDPATAEDICQDVAERVLRANVVFTDVAGLRRWSRQVARSRLIDDWRTHGRYVSPEPLPDREAPTDLTTVVAYRLALEETAAALGTVRPHEWAAMFAEAGPAERADKRTRDRDHLRRFRARERLRRAVRNFPAAAALRWRWLHRQQSVLADLGHVVAVGAAVGAALLGASPPGSPPAPASADPRPGLGAHASAPPSPAAATVPLRSPSVSAAAAPRTGGGGGAEPGPAGDWSVATVPHPVGEAKVGFVENEAHKPLACAGTEPTGSLCVPQPAAPVVLPPVPAGRAGRQIS